MKTSHIAFEAVLDGEQHMGAASQHYVHNSDVERALLDNKADYRNFAAYNSSPADLDWYRPQFALRLDKNFYDCQLKVSLKSQRLS